VDRTKIIIFVLQGIAAAFAGIVVAAQQQNGQPGMGEGLELKAISACVLGGVSLTGGVGTMTVVGVKPTEAAVRAKSLTELIRAWVPVSVASR
jgi:L-arabinose transport system permease protein